VGETAVSNFKFESYYAFRINHTGRSWNMAISVFYLQIVNKEWNGALKQQSRGKKSLINRWLD